MEGKKNYSKLIDAYLDGELTSGEKQFFENELLKNQDLARDLELHREVNETLRDTNVIKFRQKLDKIHATIEPEYQQSLAGKVIRSKYSRIAAASVVVLFTAGMLINSLTNQPLNTEKLFNRYYEIPEISDNVRSDDAVNMLFFKAVSCYSDRQFSEAVVLFEQIIQVDSKNMEAHLGAGISNIEINQPTKAEKSFETVIKQKDNLYVDQANWYLGLCYLKMNDLDKAEHQFEQIAADERAIMQGNAKKILKKLD
jgi:tetratricopeptide (TPR) repeat protein